MSSDQSVFTFELNETLYFERGQEVEELRGISLDPEITIQALDDYISITGVIELNGNYHKIATTDDSREDLYDFSSEIKRFIENVEERNETEAEFTHRFPVEISVPTYRVASMDDVAVSVESFDYELPNNGQLKLYSTIAIHGINQESAVDEVVQEERREEDTLGLDESANNESEPVSVEQEVEESFEFEIKQQDEANQEVELSSELDTPVLSDDREETEEITDVEVGQKEEELIDVEEEEKEEETKEGRWSFKTQSQSLSEFFAKGDETVPEVEDVDLDDSDVEVDEVDDSHAEIVYENRADAQDEKDITYLSDIFRESDEEDFTKIRVCIVQKDDTIETISERFEVSPLQVIKQNQLEEDFDVSEGQILYIPTKK